MLMTIWYWGWTKAVELVTPKLSKKESLWVDPSPNCLECEGSGWVYTSAHPANDTPVLESCVCTYRAKK